MGSQVSLAYHVDQVGSVSVAALAAAVAAVPLPADILTELGVRVVSDNTPIAAPITRTIVLAFGPTSAAIATAAVQPGPEGAPLSGIVATAGAGYVRPPIVSVAPPASGEVPPAKALAQAFLHVLLATIVAGGGSYSATPHVAFVGGLPPADANNPTSTFAVNSLSLVKKGRKYTSQAVVQFRGSLAPGGHQATANLTLDANGSVSSVTVTDPGSGYLTIPTAFVFDPGNNTGGVDPEFAAQIVVQPGMGVPATGHATVVGNAINTVVVDTPGSGYIRAPAVVISDITGLGAVVTASSMGVDTPLRLTYAGKGYLFSAPPAVTLTPLFLALFPNLTPTGVDAKTLASQAGPFFDLMTRQIQQAVVTPVRADAPVVS